MGKNIGFVSTRFAGTDGVTLESSGSTRQTVWDKLAETVVVRKGAEPAGQNPRAYKQEFVNGMVFVSSEPS